MNRRQLFARLAGLGAALGLTRKREVPLEPAPTPAWHTWNGNEWLPAASLYGIPIVRDEHCPPGKIYFIDKSPINDWQGRYRSAVMKEIAEQDDRKWLDDHRVRLPGTWT